MVMTKSKPKKAKGSHQHRDLYQDITDKVIAAIDTGHVPWQKPWVGGASNAPRNAFTHKAYRGWNTWQLMWEAQLKGYATNEWLTYKQAQEHATKLVHTEQTELYGKPCDACEAGFKGREVGGVKTGEKSTQVIFWKVIGYNKQNDAGEMESRSGLLLRYYNVFNVAQTYGVRTPSTAGLGYDVKEFDPIEEAEAIFDGYEDCPSIIWGQDKAAYSPDLDVLMFPDREQFKTPEGAYATFFHEFTHSTLHESRLNRKDAEEAGSHRFGSKMYAKEELVAEMGSTMLMAMCGLESTFDNSVAYLRGWRDAIAKDNKLLIHAAANAQKSCDYILGTFSEEEREENGGPEDAVSGS